MNRLRLGVSGAVLGLALTLSACGGDQPAPAVDADTAETGEAAEAPKRVSKGLGSLSYNAIKSSSFDRKCSYNFHKYFNHFFTIYYFLTSYDLVLFTFSFLYPDFGKSISF